MTNVPAPSFDATGLSIPDQSAILAGLLADFRAAFGSNFSDATASPGMQLMVALAAVIGAKDDLLLNIVNQIDPAFADGRMQDAIARIYYLSRLGPLATTVDCTLSGAVGTVVPAGALALASDGTIYQSLGQVTIGSSGTVAASFAAIIDGPIPCPAGSLNKVYRAVPGWDAITNAADGVLGRNAETRAAFEARRNASVAVNALGVLPSIRAAVLQVPDVIDAYAIDNPSGTTLTIGTVTIAARSLYVAVVGGTDADVARAIWKKKSPGCGYQGNTTVTVLDTSSGYDMPYPSYDVTFQRPDALPIYVAVTLTNSGLVPSDVETQVRNAIVAAFSGLDGGPRARVGAMLYASRFYAPVALLGSWAQIVSIKIGTTSTPTSDDIAIEIDQVPTISAANIAVTLT